MKVVLFHLNKRDGERYWSGGFRDGKPTTTNKLDLAYDLGSQTQAYKIAHQHGLLEWRVGARG